MEHTNKPGRPGYWQNMWRERRQIMSDNLAKINAARSAKADEKIRLIAALIPQLPAGPLTSTELRNAVREAFNLSYGESLTAQQAWNLVRAARRKDIFKVSEDGTYTIHQAQ